MAEILQFLAWVKGPATLIAYMAALATWAYVLPTLAKLSAASRDLRALPSKPPEIRINALKIIYGPIPEEITADEWIRDRRNRLILVGFVASVLAIVVTLIWIVA